jgi:DNA (cytosine-5)-methyltransferase 1
MTDEHNQYAAIDVFSGCGGMTEGLRGAGFKVLAGIEIDAAASITYQLNHPDTFLFSKDIRLLQTQEILNKLHLKKDELDLLAGCSPCQGFSRMRTGNRKEAVNDPRNDLVLEFVRLAEDLGPRTLLFENVPGLMSDARFSTMIERLKNAGYELDYKAINLVDYGIPQRRKRLILLGSRLSKPSLPIGTYTEKRVTVKEAIGLCPQPDKSEDPLQKSLSTHSKEVAERIRAIPKDGGSRTALGQDAQLACHKRLDGYKDVYGRMAWKKPAPTITRFCVNPSKGRYIHPDQDREITLREASLLQTFPPTYNFPLTDVGRGAIASMIGEALPPRFAEVLGIYLKDHLQTQTNK